jgi:formylmethanofuran dehydrogenase subunit E
VTVEEKKPETVATVAKVEAAPAKAPAEKQTNCLGCGKPIIKLKRYYRDGKFYCSKICWRKKKEKDREAKK